MSPAGFSQSVLEHSKGQSCWMVRMWNALRTFVICDESLLEIRHPNFKADCMRGREALQLVGRTFVDARHEWAEAVQRSLGDVTNLWHQTPRLLLGRPVGL